MGYDEYLANLGLKHHCLYKEQFVHELFLEELGKIEKD